jgi:subtilisin family serine protease
LLAVATVVSLIGAAVGGVSAVAAPVTAADSTPLVPTVETGLANGSGAGNDTESASNSTAAGSSVRLITGDQVLIDANGAVRSTVLAPRPDGRSAHLSISQTADGIFVFPSDVVALIGHGLDQALFNVSLLASYDLGPNGDLPLIVETNPLTSISRGAAFDMDAAGLSVTTRLTALPATVGWADTSVEAGPAPSWGLIEALAQPTAEGLSQRSAANAAVSQIWLDRQHQFDLSTITALTEVSDDTPAWMSLIGADQAHDAGLLGEGVTVAVVDTGIDTRHPDLAGQVIDTVDFSVDGDGLDHNGHGTFVASEIAGTGAASAGLYQGVAPKAQLLSAKVVGADGSGTDSQVIEGMEWAASHGADIVNMSLGFPGYYDDGSLLVSRTLDALTAEYGCLFVVATGNDMSDQAINAPATASEALAVGATDQFGNLGWWSSTGPRRGDGAVSPQIMAPGAALAPVDETGFPLLDESGMPLTTGLVGAGAGSDGYVSDNYYGTSMAAPLVAGAAALLLESDPTLDRDGLESRLMAGASPLPDGSAVFQQGAGLLNIPASLAANLIPDSSSLDFGAFDPPAATSAERTLTWKNLSDQDQMLDLAASLVSVPSRGLATVDTAPTANPGQALAQDQAQAGLPGHGLAAQ